MRWLKWSTERRANRILERTGLPFWQDESFDHWIRDEQDFERLVEYVVWNPVAAGLVDSARQWRWSSANGSRPVSTGRRQDRLPHREYRNSSIVLIPTVWTSEPRGV